MDWHALRHFPELTDWRVENREEVRYRTDRCPMWFMETLCATGTGISL